MSKNRKRSRGPRTVCRTVSDSKMSEIRSKGTKGRPQAQPQASTPGVVRDAQGRNRDKLETQEQKDNCLKLVNYILHCGAQLLMDNYTTDIRPFVPLSATRVAFDANMDKNRYNDVICNDQNRIILSLDDGPSDYIHANSVKGPPLMNSFICTQGPKENTIIDFYRMVTQQNVSNIFMLCETKELGKEKCAQYWPRKPGDILTFGEFKVSNIGKDKEERDERTNISRLEIKCHRGTYSVKHYLWLDWPDRGVPETTKCPLRLLKHSRRSPRPTVVHCSAGIGRTGSIVAIEYVLQGILSLSKASLPDMIKEVRSQRLLAVQTDVQYLYIARVVLEFYEGYVKDPDINKRCRKFDLDVAKIMNERNGGNDIYAPLKKNA